MLFSRRKLPSARVVLKRALGLPQLYGDERHPDAI
jgi:hypothetical protein